MAEKIKKGFFKVLPLSVVVFLVIGLAVAFTMPTPQNPGVNPALAADTILTSVYADNDANGTVDRIVWTMDENVTACAYDASDWSVGTAGSINVAITGLSCTGADAILNILVTADATETGGAVNPIISYTNNANRITLTSGNMASHAGVTATDGAAPVVLAATYLDNNGDGEVDRVRFATSTDVGIVCTAFTGAADFTVGTAGTVGVAAAAGDTCSTGGTTEFTIILATAGTTNTTGGSTAPVVTYTQPGNGVEDGAGNDVPTAAGVTVADGASPVVLTATYLDNDASGEIDRVRFNTTADVGIVCTAFTGGADFTVGTAGTVGVAAAAGDTCTTNGTTNFTVVLATAGTTDTTGGSTAPVVTYTQPGNGVEDGAGNDVPTAAGVTVADGAAPLVVSATFYDASPATNDGKLDIITVVWTENISAVADGSADWALTSAANFAGIVEGVVVCNSGAAAANECDYNFTTTTVKTDVGDLSLAYTAGTSVTDGINTAASKTITSASTPAFSDGAAPVVASTSPAASATGVALDASFSITFSEAMTTGDITSTTLGRTPTFTLGSAAWTVGNTVVTYASHEAWAGLQTYSIDLVQGSINSAAAGDGTLDNTAIVADPYTFTTVAATSGGGSGGSSLPTSMTVTAPNGGETLTGGGTYNITWSASGATDTVSLYYSIDSGINFPYTIATGETNDGSYTWTVPNIGTSTAKVKAVAGSLNDISDANFTITYATTQVSASTSTVAASPTSVVANGTSKSTITVTVKDASSSPLSGKVVTLSSSRDTSDTVTTVTGTTGTNGVATFEVKSSTAGTSTYTATAAGVVLNQTAAVVFTAPGEPEVPAETPVSLSVGDLIKSGLSSAVYYYGSDGKRHVFPNEKTYKSWYADFSNIKTVTNSQLQGIALGKNVTIRPGTVLVKIQTDPKVYAVEPGGLLRWVPTEARAITLYGSNWAQKIIDVPVVFWGDYTFGSDITTDAHPTGAVVQYSGSTDKYYIQGSERRLISTAGFTANRFQLGYVLSIPTTLSYALGSPLTTEETSLTRIY